MKADFDRKEIRATVNEMKSVIGEPKVKKDNTLIWVCDHDNTLITLSTPEPKSKNEECVFEVSVSDTEFKTFADFLKENMPHANRYEFAESRRRMKDVFGEPMVINASWPFCKTDDGVHFSIYVKDANKPTTKYKIFADNNEQKAKAYRYVMKKLHEAEASSSTFGKCEEIYNTAVKQIMQELLKLVPKDGDTLLADVEKLKITNQRFYVKEYIEGTTIQSTEGYTFAGIKRVNDSVRLLGYPIIYGYDPCKIKEFNVDGFVSDYPVFDIMNMVIRYDGMDALHLKDGGTDDVRD